MIAHSMGNQVVLEALAHAIGGPLSRPIGELITAAPDVDRDHYRGIAARVRAVSRGMTLYASSADKALITSRELAGIPRAGDVGPDGPWSSMALKPSTSPQLERICSASTIRSLPTTAR